MSCFCSPMRNPLRGGERVADGQRPDCVTLAIYLCKTPAKIDGINRNCKEFAVM